MLKLRIIFYGASINSRKSTRIVNLLITLLLIPVLCVHHKSQTPSDHSYGLCFDYCFSYKTIYPLHINITLCIMYMVKSLNGQREKMLIFYRFAPHNKREQKIKDCNIDLLKLSRNKTEKKVSSRRSKDIYHSERTLCLYGFVYCNPLKSMILKQICPSILNVFNEFEQSTYK